MAGRTVGVLIRDPCQGPRPAAHAARPGARHL